MLDPKAKSLLDQFTLVAKKVIYNAERMKQFMQMLGTPEGAVTAVQSVISVIERRKPVPPELLPLLGVNIYMAMVDIAQESTGHKADPGIMKSVIGAILQKVKPSQPAPQQPAAPAQGGGLLSQMQGAPA